MHLLNAIPGALVPSEGVMLSIIPVDPDVVGAAMREGRCLSAVGHADTAAIIGGLVGAEVPMARVSVPVLKDGDTHLLALYQGPRLPEGATTLPEGASLQFYRLQAASPAGFQARVAEDARADGCEPAGAIDWAAAAWKNA
jgi:hypothetical protein